METSEVITTRRTVRLFKQRALPYHLIEKCVDAGRLAPSARNLQLLEYVVVDSNGPLDEMFRCMGFGGDVETGGFDGNEPRAYVVILINREIPSKWDRHDSAMAAENIMLSAWDVGIGSCALARIDRKQIMQLLHIPEQYEIDLVVALGYPAEQPVAEDIPNGRDTGYYRDRDGRLHIPKRKLGDVLHRNGFRS